MRPSKKILDEEIGALQMRVIDAMRVYRELRQMLANARQKRAALDVIPARRRAA